MARQPRTPGAKTETKTAEVQTTAQTSTDDAMDAVLGKAEAPAAADPAETPKTAEDVLADILSGDAEGQDEAHESFISFEQFDAVAADLNKTKEQLVAAQQDFTAFKNDVAAMLFRVAELQGKAQPIIANATMAQAIPVKKRMKSVLSSKGWIQVESEE